MRSCVVALIGCLALIGCSSGKPDATPPVAPLPEAPVAPLPEAPPLADSPPPQFPIPPPDRCEAVEPEDRGDIVFARGTILEPELWTVRDDGSDLRPLGEGGGAAGNDPAWSPGGCAVAYSFVSDEGARSVVGAAADGSDPVTLHRTTSLILHRPAWSPGGSELLFTPAGESRIVEVSARGGPERDITPAGIEVISGGVAWSPEGDQLVVAGRAGSRPAPDLHVIRPDGSAVRRLTDTVAGEAWPDWSPDGRRIAFTRGDVGPRGDPGVFVVDRGGGEASRVGSYGDCCAVWSPDGRMLLVERKGLFDEEGFSEPPELWIVDVETGEERRLVSGRARDADWSTAGGSGTP